MVNDSCHPDVFAPLLWVLTILFPTLKVVIHFPLTHSCLLSPSEMVDNICALDFAYEPYDLVGDF